MPTSNNIFHSSTDLVIGSESELRKVKKLPELIEIDKEIGHPYLKNPILWNSEAWSRKLELPWVISRVGLCEGLTVLDVGSGVSALPIFFSRRKAIAFSVDTIIFSGLSNHTVTRVQAALPQLPFRDESFDIVCCISVVEHILFDLSICFKELCRVARKQVILTFDIATTPLSTIGLSGAELRAVGRALGKPIVVPKDLLPLSNREKELINSDIAVCLLRVKRKNGVWPVIKQGKIHLALVRLHRFIKKWRLWIKQRIRRRSPYSK